SGRIRRRAPGRPPGSVSHAATRGSRLFQGVAAPDDLELVPAILRPRCLVVSLRDRALFAVGHRLDARRLDAVADEILLRGGGPAGAEGQAVLVRPALGAVPAGPAAEVWIRR